MKKTIIILFVIAAVIGVVGSIYYYGSIFTDCPGNRTTGSGTLVTRTVELSAFDKVKASRAVKVVFTDNGTTQAVIEADDNIIDRVVVHVEGRELKVGIDPSIRSISNLNITVTVPTNGVLRGLEANSAASISGDVVLTGPELELEASSAARIDIKANVTKCKAEASSAAVIEAEITATICEVEASSAATIKFQGKAESCEVDIDSASKFKATDFVVVNYKVDASSAAKARINCTGTLQAKASSGASISYTGDCTADKNASSGGSIHKN